MLSESNARILQALKNVGGIVFSDQWPTGFDRMRMDELVRLGYVNSSRHESGMAVYQLMPAGDDALSEYFQYCADRARDEADKHLQKELEHKRWRKDSIRSWVQWTVTTILTIASFFAGAIAEMLTGFIEWIAAFFHP